MGVGSRARRRTRRTRLHRDGGLPSIPVAVAPTFAAPPSFIQWAQRLYEAQYSGPTTVHWLHGQPKLIEFQREHVAVPLDTGAKVVNS